MKMNRQEIQAFKNRVLADSSKAVITITEPQLSQVIGDDGSDCIGIEILSDKGVEDAVKQATQQIQGATPTTMLLYIEANYDLMMDEMASVADFIEALHDTRCFWGLCQNTSLPQQCRLTVVYSL